MGENQPKPVTVDNLVSVIWDQVLKKQDQIRGDADKEIDLLKRQTEAHKNSYQQAVKAMSEGGPAIVNDELLGQIRESSSAIREANAREAQLRQAQARELSIFDNLGLAINDPELREVLAGMTLEREDLDSLGLMRIMDETPAGIVEETESRRIGLKGGLIAVEKVSKRVKERIDRVNQSAEILIEELARKQPTLLGNADAELTFSRYLQEVLPTLSIEEAKKLMSGHGAGMFTSLLASATFDSQSSTVVAGGNIDLLYKLSWNLRAGQNQVSGSEKLVEGMRRFCSNPDKKVGDPVRVIVVDDLESKAGELVVPEEEAVVEHNKRKTCLQVTTGPDGLVRSVVEVEADSLPANGKRKKADKSIWDEIEVEEVPDKPTTSRHNDEEVRREHLKAKPVKKAMVKTKKRPEADQSRRQENFVEFKTAPQRLPVAGLLRQGRPESLVAFAARTLNDLERNWEVNGRSVIWPVASRDVEAGGIGVKSVTIDAALEKRWVVPVELEGQIASWDQAGVVRLRMFKHTEGDLGKPKDRERILERSDLYIPVALQVVEAMRNKNKFPLRIAIDIEE